MDTKGLIAAREQLDSLAGYLLKASIRDKVEGRLFSTFTVEAVVNMAATLTKCVTILEATLGNEAPPQPSPSFPQPGPATPTAPADGMAKALADFNAQLEKMMQDIRQDALRKVQEQYQAAQKGTSP